jgi:hypothetical protein
MRRLACLVDPRAIFHTQLADLVEPRGGREASLLHFLLCECFGCELFGAVSGARDLLGCRHIETLRLRFLVT